MYKSLSKNAQLALKNVTINSKNTSIEDIERGIFEEEIMEKSLSEFINYTKIDFDSDIKEIQINKSQLIERKLNQELKNINKENFIKYKDDIIYLSEKIENKIVELNILRKIEELRFQYENVIVNKEIAKIKKNIKYKKDNKILKSI